MAERTCLNCGQVFTVKRSDQRCCKRPYYCSVQCGRHVAKRTRRALQRRAYQAPVYRKRIYERDRWVCQLCGKPTRPDKAKSVGTKDPHPLAPVLDHIIPLSQGGPHHPDNVQCAHYRCNSIKSDGVMGNGEQLRLQLAS